MSQETRFRKSEGSTLDHGNVDEQSIHRLGRAITIVLLVCLAVLLASVFATQARAHHEQDHKQLVIGEASKYPVAIMICDTPSQAMNVAGAKSGNDFNERYRKFFRLTNEYGEHACQVMRAWVTPLELLHETKIEENDVRVFKFRSQNGRIFYGVVFNVPIIENSEVGIYESRI